MVRICNEKRRRIMQKHPRAGCVSEAKVRKTEALVDG